MRVIQDQPDTGNPLRLFEENYFLLACLLPELRWAKGGTAPGPRPDFPGLEVEVVERSRYTTTLLISKCFDVRGRLLPDLNMTVRSYHDARVAEVIAYQGCLHIPPRYAALGRAQYQKDERRQVNRLLNQLLHYCMPRDDERDANGCLSYS